MSHFIIRSILSILLSGVIAGSVSTMAIAASPAVSSAAPFQHRLGVSLGYRHDDLDWNIAGDASGNNPTILSELTWEDLGIFQLTASASAVFPSIYLRGSLSYGWILSGDNQDSDYLGDDRTFEYSRSNNSADDGNTMDLSVGIGYPFMLRSGFVGIAPLVGYSYQEQNLTLTDGSQTLTVAGGVPLGPFSGLNSTYDAEWKGPWIGIDVAFNMPSSQKDSVPRRYQVLFGLEYHWADYKAQADWNLSTDFSHPKSFEHETDATGVIFSAEFSADLNRHWILNLNAIFQRWEGDPGTDRTLFTDGTVTETRLNEVNWDSFALMLGAVYRF